MKFSPIGLRPVHIIPIFSQHLITTFLSQITKNGGCYLKNNSMVIKFGIKENPKGFFFLPADLFRAFNVLMFNRNPYKGRCQECIVDHATFSSLTEYQKSIFGNSVFLGLFRCLVPISCVFTLPHSPVRNSAESKDQLYNPVVFSSRAISSQNHLLRVLFMGHVHD